MREQIIHELAIICRAYGFNGDPSLFLSKSPQWITLGFQQMGVHWEVIGIVSSWGDTLSDDEVLGMLKEFNDKGTIFLRDSS